MAAQNQFRRSGLLHGGEPRPSSAEICAGFRRAEARHAALVTEYDWLCALLTAAGCQVEPGWSGMAFFGGEDGAGAARGTVSYHVPGRRFKITLEAG